MMFYAVYDKNDFLVSVFETLKEVAFFLKTSVDVLYSRFSRCGNEKAIMQKFNIYKIYE